MWSTLKTKLSNCDWFDGTRSVTKTNKNNDVTDFIGLVYVKTKIKLLVPTELGVILDENKTW